MLGFFRTRSNNRRAAPVGLRRLFSQLIFVTLETSRNRANTAWLPASCSMISLALIGFDGARQCHGLGAERELQFASGVAGQGFHTSNQIFRVEFDLFAFHNLNSCLTTATAAQSRCLGQ